MLLLIYYVLEINLSRVVSLEGLVVPKVVVSIVVVYLGGMVLQGVSMPIENELCERQKLLVRLNGATWGCYTVDEIATIAMIFIKTVINYLA